MASRAASQKLKWLWNCALAASLSSVSVCAGAQESKPAELPVTAIVGGDVWTVTKGVIKGGTVLIKGSRIDKVGGPELPVPAGAKVIEAKGKVIAPGLVLPMMSGAMRGGGAGGRLKDALDPYSLPISLALATGVTSAYTTGAGGGFGGFGGGGGGGEEGAAAGGSGLSANNAVIKMTSGDIGGMLLKEPSNTTLTLGGGGGGGGRRGGGGGFGRLGGGGGGGQLTAKYNLRDLFRRAKEYQDKVEQYEKGGKKGAAPRKPAGIDDALLLVKKERMLRVTASEVTDIRAALSLVDDFGVKVVITPATEAWIIPDEIAKRGSNVMLLITARSRVPSDSRMNKPNGSNHDAAGILNRAGVKFALIPPSSQFSTGGELGRDLLTYPLEADFAIRGGMDEKAAFEAITINAAQMLGVADRVGSIEEGKDADIVIFSGDPLDYRAFAEKTFVNGQLLYEKDKSTFFSYVRDRALGEER